MNRYLQNFRLQNSMALVAALAIFAASFIAVVAVPADPASAMVVGTPVLA